MKKLAVVEGLEKSYSKWSMKAEEEGLVLKEKTSL